MEVTKRKYKVKVLENYKGLMQILLLLDEFDGELFKTQMEDGLYLNDRTIESARDDLARNGFVDVERRIDEDNRTRIYTTLTEKGKEVLLILKKLEEIL